MEIAIGLPNSVAGATGAQLVEFARRAEQVGFPALGTIDRLVYPNHESLVTLAAAAAVTERIKLATTVLLAPYRANGALIAKQAATLHRLSGGRLSLGLGIGWRADDYEVSGVPWEERGRIFDEMLATIRSVWERSGEEGSVGPDVAADPPELMVGGSIDKAFRRAARFGSGWILGGGTPDQLAEGREKLLAAWRDEGREGEPRVGALAYYALGPSGREDAQRALGHYYAAMGEGAQAVVDSAATDAETVRAYIQAFAERGCDELYLFPCNPDPGQVDLLADAAL